MNIRLIAGFSLVTLCLFVSVSGFFVPYWSSTPLPFLFDYRGTIGKIGLGLLFLEIFAIASARSIVLWKPAAVVVILGLGILGLLPILSNLVGMWVVLGISGFGTILFGISTIVLGIPFLLSQRTFKYRNVILGTVLVIYGGISLIPLLPIDLKFDSFLLVIIEYIPILVGLAVIFLGNAKGALAEEKLDL